MAQATQTYRRSLSGSVGAGMKSVFGGNGRTYYTLVHKVSSKYHRAGESQPIIVDEIEIGRDPRCQVRFDDSFTTVSRRHAAIVRDGEQWKLVQLSTTNSTYLNGHHVHKEWYLQNGDEIQLSTNGPKLGFIIPEGEKSKVSSIGLTARLNLFRQQALRPYKTALTILSCVLLLAIAGLAWTSIDSHKIKKQLAETIRVSDSIQNANKIKMEMLTDSIKSLGQRADSLNSQIANLEKRNKELSGRIGSLRSRLNTMVGPTSDELKAYSPHVYFVVTLSADVISPEGRSYHLEAGSDFGWIGTGFLLEDGTFVTSRHVVEPWYFWTDLDDMGTFYEMNKYANNGGRIVVHYAAVSSTEDVIEFSSNEMHCNRNRDQVDYIGSEKITMANCDENDIAYIRTSHKGGLKYDSEKSRNLKSNTNLTIIGFPLGLGVKAFDRIEPLVSNARVASNGLHNNMIVTTAMGSEQGNSGGPVFISDGSGKLVVVGVVSAGFGKNMGLVVPISKIK